MDPPNRRQEASALSETSYLADVIILTARKVSTPIILVAATIAQAHHTIIVIGQCSYQHTPVFCCQMLQSTPSARSHPIIGSTQANNWWPITRNWSIVCVRNILGVCWSKQEEDWWVWLLYKSRAINLCWRHVYMTCSLGTSWPFPLVLFCVAYSHTGWKHLASAPSP